MSAPQQNPDEVTVSEFLGTEKGIEGVLDAGYGFVPLVGAGLSAPSGIPIIREVHVYLRRCIARALGIDHPKVWSTKNRGGTLEYHRFRRWNPGADRWPRLGDLQQMGRDTEVWDQRLHEVLGEFTSRARHNGEWSPEHDVFQEAYGAMADWRSSLLFLSRLHKRIDSVSSGDANQGKQGRATVPRIVSGHLWILGERRADVIDTFFLSVISGKEPTLGHRMLARLADTLRVDTVLTTNFDELMERAFVEIGRPVTVFDVHKDARLPPFEDVRAGNALIKLHGGRYGLRADHSLDALPDDVDRRRFVSYLARRKISQTEWDGFRTSDKRQAIATRRHLFVVGISGQDQRITSLIATAAQVLKNLQVFWLCFLERDMRDVQTLANQLKQATSPGSTDIRVTFRILRHQNVGLFFQQLLQHRTCALPATGVMFPSGPRLPVPARPFHQPTPHEGRETASRETTHADYASIHSDYVEKLRSAIDLTFKQEADQPRLLLATSYPGIHGVASCAAKAFEEEIDNKRQCVWLDLDEITSADDLFEQMLHTIARKAGIADWMPVILDEHAIHGTDSKSKDDYLLRARVREIRRLTNNPQRDWVVFLNARDGAGSNALGFQLEGSVLKWRSSIPNGWLDHDGKRDSRFVGVNLEPDANGPEVVHLLQSLCGTQQHPDDLPVHRNDDGCPNLTIIVLCWDRRTGKRSSHRGFVDFVVDSKDDDRLPSPQFQFVQPKPPIPLEETCSPINQELDGILHELVRDWISGDATDSQPSNNPGTPLQRARFLYALTLVNRTRYLSMMWSWAFHGGRPEHGKDDIESKVRRDNTDAWLESLTNRNIVRWKSGGFVWLHCRVRNALRKQLASLQVSDVMTEDELSAFGDTTPRLRLGEWLTTLIHHALAEWWTKLFLASGDSAAAFEAIYHRCLRVSAILMKPQERNERSLPLKPKKRMLFSLSEVRNDLAGIHRLLAQAKPALLISGYSKGSCRRLQALRQVLGRLEGNALTKLSGKSDEVDSQILQIRQMFDRINYASLRLNRAIAREVAENATAYKRQWELLWWMKHSNRSVSEDTDNSREKRTQFEAAYSSLSGPSREWRLGQRRFGSSLILHAKKNPATFMEACIEFGTLGIGVRSYRSAERYLQLARASCGLTDKVLQPPTGEDYRFTITVWAENQRNNPADPQDSDSPEAVLKSRILFYRMLKVLQREQQLFLIWGRTKHLLARREEESLHSESLRSEAKDHFDKAVVWYRCAVEIQRFLARNEYLELIDPKLSGLDEYGMQDGFDDRQRLLTQCAVAHSFRNRDFRKAHRRLAEAEASLSQSGHSPDSIEMAIIELHRAEVLTHQAVLEAGPDGETDERLTKFGAMRRQLLELAHDEPADTNWTAKLALEFEGSSQSVVA